MISVTLLTAAAMTAISCPPSHPEIAMSTLLGDHSKKAKSSSDCRVCDSKNNNKKFDS